MYLYQSLAAAEMMTHVLLTLEITCVFANSVLFALFQGGCRDGFNWFYC